MKNKTLALVNGIVGLVGGIFLLLAVFFLAGSVLKDAADTAASFGNMRTTVSTSNTSFMASFIMIVKFAILGLGIYGAVYYKGDTRVGTAPHVLLIVGGAVALIPFLGWIGGIVAIVGGSLYLAKLKNFESN